MEKDNKKARDDARRDYNDTVRSLAKFLRKRDPRYKAHLAQQSSIVSAATVSGSSTPRKQPPLDGPIYVEQAWQKLDPYNAHDDLEWAAAEGGEDAEEWECVVCAKAFRSEAAWNSHERSKKHLREVERLKRQMLDEDVEFGLDGEKEDEALRDEEDNESQENPPRSSFLAVARSPSPPIPHATSPPDCTTGGEEDRNKQKQSRRTGGPASLEPVTETEKNARTLADEDTVGVPDVDVLGMRTQTELTKREKRRARQVKKAEASEGATGSKQFRCNVCSMSFPSRTKLFSHINGAGHGLAKPANDNERPESKKGKSRRQ